MCESKYSSVRSIFKIVQFCIFITILLMSILNIYETSISEWIITAYLIIISLLIFITLFVNKLYSIFPYLQKGYKLAITVFLMGGFAFGDDLLNIRSILSFVILFLSIIFFVISVFFSDEEKINDIIMNNRKENENLKNEESKEKKDGDFEFSARDEENSDRIKIEKVTKKGPLF